MQFCDCIRTQLARQTAHGFVVGNLAAADASELPVHKVGAHFARYIFVAPPAHMLQQQHSQYNFSRGSPAPASLALFDALAQLCLNDLQQLVVMQRLIGMPHPGLPQIGHFLGEEAIGEAALKTAGGDHA